MNNTPGLDRPNPLTMEDPRISPSTTGGRTTSTTGNTVTHTATGRGGVFVRTSTVVGRRRSCGTVISGHPPPPLVLTHSVSQTPTGLRAGGRGLGSSIPCPEPGFPPSKDRLGFPSERFCSVCSGLTSLLRPDPPRTVS